MCLYVLGFLTMKMKAFRVTQNDSPKMVKMSASNNKLSRFGVEQVLSYHDVIHFRNTLLDST